jgi:hypothetical protein
MSMKPAEITPALEADLAADGRRPDKECAATTPIVARDGRLRPSPLAPAYYLGRPAYQWAAALGPRRRAPLVALRVERPEDDAA